MKQLPIGEHNFDRIREEGLLYVDKTRQLFDLTNLSNYVFLSRPRRFGKSLLVSTLEALFLGRKELFKGLWIEDKIEWEPFPVVRLDFSSIPVGDDLQAFNDRIVRVLTAAGARHGLQLNSTFAPYCLSDLLTGLHQKTGKRVVVLIDEYDKPITDYLTEPDKAEAHRTWLRSFYEIFKGQSMDVHFLFMTGVSKFSKMSLFSVLNNLKDASLLPPFNDVVGFTDTELDTWFVPYLEEFARREGTSVEVLREKIRHWYDGYSWDGVGRIYNPWAVVNLFSDWQFNNSWFESGTPNFLIRLIKEKYGVEMDRAPAVEDFDNVPALKQTFDSYDLRHIDLVPLLFQTGYLTVKKQEDMDGQTLYTLGYPNYEVRWSMSSHILEAFTQINVGLQIMPKALKMKQALQQADPQEFLLLLRSLFAGIPFDILKKVNEYYYQSLFYFLLNMLGVENVVLEKSGYIGKADGVLDWNGKVWVFEFKFARKGSMQALLDSAMKQIEEKGYHHPFQGGGKEIHLVAVGLLYKPPGKGKASVLTVDGAWKSEK